MERGRGGGRELGGAAGSDGVRVGQSGAPPAAGRLRRGFLPGCCSSGYVWWGGVELWSVEVSGWMDECGVPVTLRSAVAREDFVSAASLLYTC